MTNPEIDNDGNKKWFDENGKYHREDGPAYEKHGVKWWYRHGKPHRLDGPAITDGLSYTGMNYWYVNGKEIDIKPILERLDISLDWQNWTEEEKFLVKLAIS